MMTSQKITELRLNPSNPNESIEEKCVKLGRTFFTGTWSTLSETDIVVNLISGNETKQLYHVMLKPEVLEQHNDVGPNVPHSIVVKLFRTEHFDVWRLSTHSIVLSLASNLKVCPRVYGALENGFVQHYYEHIPIHMAQKQDNVLRKVAHLLARINSMEAPVEKSISWLDDQMQNTINDIRSYKPWGISTSIQFDNILELDWALEVSKIKGLIDELNAPIVFSHNDFRGKSFMVGMDCQAEAPKVMLCDFEYSRYGFRGFDIALFLSEYALEPNELNEIYMPPDDVIIKFANFYLEGWDIVRPGYLQEQENSLDQIVRETKVFICANLLLFITVLVFQTSSFNSKKKYKPEDKLTLTKSIFNNYKDAVIRLIKDGILNAEPELKYFY